MTAADSPLKLDERTEDSISMLLIGQNRVMLTRTGTDDRLAMLLERDRLRNALRTRIRELVEEARNAHLDPLGH